MDDCRNVFWFSPHSKLCWMDAAVARRGVVEQPDDEEEWDQLPAGVGSRSSDDEPWALVGDMPSGERVSRRPAQSPAMSRAHVEAKERLTPSCLSSRRCGGWLVASG